MKLEKKKTKQTGQAKNLRGAKETLGAMQTNNKIEIWECLLHMWENLSHGSKLADGTYVVKSKSGCIYEIRHKNTKTAVHHLQHVLRRSRGGILRTDVKRGRTRIHGKIRSRQKGNSKSSRPLFKSNPPLRRITSQAGIYKKR